LLQEAANAIYSASQVALVAVGLTLIYSVGRYLHFAHGATYTVAAYGALICSSRGLPLILAVVAGMLIGGLFGVLTQVALYKTLQDRGSHALEILLASLGLFILVQSTIAIAFGESVRILRVTEVVEGYPILGARLTGIQVVGILGAICFCSVLSIFLARSYFGRIARAVANDAYLAKSLGVRISAVNIWVALIAGLLVGFAGVVSALDIDARPTMGFRPLLLGMVAMLAGGAGQPLGAMAAAVLIGVAQQVAVAYLSAEWQDTVIFVILALVLLFRPEGIFSRLRITTAP
jgi:branched-chain amino acid transport system permease protein